MARQTVSSERDLTFTMGREELVIHRRYEVLGIVNDFLIGIWFVIGSVCFFLRGCSTNRWGLALRHWQRATVDTPGDPPAPLRLFQTSARRAARCLSATHEAHALGS